MGTFCHGDILCGDIVSSGTFCHGDNLERGHFVRGHCVLGDILHMGTFRTWGHFVLLPAIPQLNEDLDQTENHIQDTNHPKEQCF